MDWQHLQTPDHYRLAAQIKKGLVLSDAERFPTPAEGTIA